jgi:hypothetical protein
MSCEFLGYHSGVTENPILLEYDMKLRGNTLMFWGKYWNVLEFFQDISTLQDGGTTLPQKAGTQLSNDAVSRPRRI